MLWRSRRLWVDINALNLDELGRMTWWYNRFWYLDPRQRWTGGIALVGHRPCKKNGLKLMNGPLEWSASSKSWRCEQWCFNMSNIQDITYSSTICWLKENFRKINFWVAGTARSQKYRHKWNQPKTRTRDRFVSRSPCNDYQGQCRRSKAFLRRLVHDTMVSMYEDGTGRCQAMCMPMKWT